MSHYIYILKSMDGRLYTGYTTDLERRLLQHQQGRGAKFTKAFGVKELLYSEVFPDKSSAMKREAQIKKLPRQSKLDLIAAAK